MAFDHVHRVRWRRWRLWAHPALPAPAGTGCSDMWLRQLGHSDLIVSALGLGTVKLGRDSGVKYPETFVIPDDRAAQVSGIIRRNNPKPPSQTWKTFIKNHMPDMVAVDFLVVPTIRFKMLFVFVVLSHATGYSLQRYNESHSSMGCSTDY